MADENLKSMLNQAMRSPRHFALAVKGSEVALYVSKKPVQGSMLKELKARVGATKSYEGVCRSGEAGLTFQSLDAIPPTLVSPLKAHVKEETGLNISPKFEQVASLEAVVDDSPALKVEGGKPAIDVLARQRTELASQVDKLRRFVAEYTTNHAAFVLARQQADDYRKDLLTEINNQKAALKLAKAETPADPAKISAIDTKVRDTEKLRADHFEQWKKAGEAVKEIEKLKVQYDDDLRQFDAIELEATALATPKATDAEDVKQRHAAAAKAIFDRQFELMQHGRIQAIENVRTKMNQVYADTNRKLAILGRTKDTFGDPETGKTDGTWIAEHPSESGRVLHESDWSMAVNDAFIKAGLNQKADFAMITRFKESVLKKIKTLLMNPGGLSVDQLKQELRAFIKKEADPALFTGGNYNDGFAVSMVELEQLIDDGYVMMEHDPDGTVDESAKGKAWNAEQVMVPSGKGQKIKAELGDAVEARAKRMAERKKQVTAQFAQVVASAKERIQGHAAALKITGLIKQAIDEDNLDQAEDMLGKLRTALGLEAS